ncbi:MAG TPA: cadherin repeat domain-containing protein, partial [Prosthecobacter sp.]|nr:cadherin repeat domain-containing protein [Prosthecobacter sp.]
MPAGVVQVTVEAWGGGGGGGGNANTARGGGGGGAYTKRVLSVTGGQQYAVTVGAGGVGGAGAGVSGTAGGDSTVNLVGNPAVLVRAVGGGVSNASAGGAGGLASNCVPSVGAFSGGAGASSSSNDGGGGGAGATATANGAPGSGVTGGGSGAGKGGNSSSVSVPTALENGAAPGGGGGGKNNGSFTSGNGGSGRIVLTYAVPAAPGAGGIPASQNYTERATGQLRIAPSATVTDTDSADFDTGYLDIAITTNLDATEDKLYIATANNITLVNNQYYVNGVVFEDIQVYHSGILIGTIPAAKNGFRGNALRINFNANATPARAQDLLRSIYYQNVDKDSAVANTRTLTIQLNDGDGATMTATTNIVVLAEVFDINSTSEHWTVLLEGSNYDPSEDQQAMSGPDLVGAPGKPLLYAKYDDMGTASTSDDRVTFRLRVDDSLNSSLKYNGYIFVGYDFELDGDIDCFISMEGTTKGTKTYVYAATGANTSPSTTGLGARYVIPNYDTLTMSNYARVETIEGITEAEANTYAGADADKDYFQNFQIRFVDLASVLNPLPINNHINAGSGFTTIGQILNSDLRVGLTEITPFRFIIATSTQPNAINSDFGGVGRVDRNTSGTPYTFPTPVSFGNTAPLITTGNDATATYVIPEGTTPVATVEASDANGDTLVFGLLTGGAYGADGAKFKINPTTGALSFLTAPDYEAPTDANADNIYEVTVQVDDGGGGYDTQLVYVYVTDVAEGANARPVI